MVLLKGRVSVLCYHVLIKKFNLTQLAGIIFKMEYIKIASDIGIFAIAAYFIQRIVDSSANKRLEEFKSTLGLIQSKQTILHNKRLEIIEKLYGYIVDLSSSMYNLTNPVKMTDKDFKQYEEELTNKANESFTLFNSFYQKNKIYFNEPTCEIIDEILKKFHQVLWDYNEHKIYEVNGIENFSKETLIESRQKAIKAYESVKEEIPRARKKLEKDFRDLLRVE